MGTGHTSIAAFTCTLSDLIAFTTNPDEPETILRQDKSFGLGVTVEFGGSGAIALMPLGLTIRVNYYAKAYGSSAVIELGDTTVTTASGQFIYQPILKVPKGLVKTELHPEALYNISALLRSGSPEGPSLINGYIENLVIQIYVP